MNQKTIFVIDDIRTNLDYLVEVLSDQYKVLAAPGGDIALNIIEQLALLPDLILLDIIMPDMDGYEVCKRLKQNPRTEDIPIIFLTARTDEEDEAKGLEIGAVDYISKPVRADIVKARIKNHLALYDKSRLLEDLVQTRTKELHQTQDVIIHSLASLAETRDALADVYDALISRRVYKPPIAHDAAKKIIIKGKGTHFDPEIVDAFIASEQLFKDIAHKYHDDIA